MRYKTKDIGDEGLDIHVAVTEAWLKAECPDVDARPAEGGIVLDGHLEQAGTSTFYAALFAVDCLPSAFVVWSRPPWRSTCL